MNHLYKLSSVYEVSVVIFSIIDDFVVFPDVDKSLIDVEVSYSKDVSVMEGFVEANVELVEFSDIVDTFV